MCGDTPAAAGKNDKNKATTGSTGGGTGGSTASPVNGHLETNTKEKQDNKNNQRKGRKKKRRIKKIKRAFTNFRMLYSNINHLLSKIDSLQNIIEERKPSVIALVETKLGEQQKITIDGYHPVPMNRDENGGGVMILVKDELENITVTVEKNKEVGEVLWVTLSNGRSTDGSCICASGK